LCLSTDEDDDNPDVEADEAADAAASNSRSTVPSQGPWFDRILGT